MPKLKPGTIVSTVAEDAAITHAARSNPDAKPLTEALWKAAKPHARIGRPPKVGAKGSIRGRR